jgi:phage tail sheath protein FI
MAFQLSPGVLVTEKDLTTVVPAVATTAGAFVGEFVWGPANVATLITSENELVSTFGRPNANTHQYFFTAANFLGYGNQLQVNRVVGSASRNAIANANTAVTVTPDLILNDDTFLGLTAPVNSFVSAKHPGSIGNSVGVLVVDNGNWANTSAVYQTLFDAQPNVSTYAQTYGTPGANDELHIAIIDEDGEISGTKGTVLEKFQYLSKAADAVDPNGRSIYYRNVLNDQSLYLRWRAHPALGTNWGTPFTGVGANSAISYATLNSSFANVISLVGGVDDSPSQGEVATGYTLFVNDELYDISLVPTGPLTGANARLVVDTLAEVRKDCVVFISPEYADVAPNLPDSTKTTNVTGFRTTDLTNLSSSYAVMDSGWKYQYDRYNDVYRWVPLNGDIAGLCARTDFVADAWFSPAGLNRGQIKNVVKLAFNPNKAQRDILYKAGVNPVISSPGTGTILFGDKTLLSRPSAFDRINVRRLFIVLEKAIAIAAKSQLFEFNDEFSRAQFRNLVEPFLRDVRGRRGITDFKVVCDTTNNTPEVIDRNEFVADIYVKPARSINFITLNFIATRTGISFEELTA